MNVSILEKSINLYLVCLFIRVYCIYAFVFLEVPGCETPPALLDGDLRDTMKSQYRHNERVEYMCQTYYTMEGEPHRTCINGAWTGYMRCLSKLQFSMS